MPDTRRHRGPHPQDVDLFAPAVHARLREAASHLRWLLDHGYAERSSLKLVGDRFALLERQRRAVMRSTCSTAAELQRRGRCVPVAALQGEAITIDGFNLLTTIEAALSGGVLLRGQDGCLRDMASMHGSYRRVDETLPALHLIGAFCQQAGVARCRWWLDEPVSNSARLRTTMLELAVQEGWNWEVQLLPDPDGPLSQSDGVIVTADAAVLDACRHWYNLAAEIVSTQLADAPVVDFREP